MSAAPSHHQAAHARRTPAVIMPARHGLPVTGWFSAHTRPARPGVYERQVRLAPFSYWDGRYWGMSSQSPETAWLNRSQPSLRQLARWRGLAEEQECTP